MPRYVILQHEMPVETQRSRHWDLMLECEEGLRTWALAAEPRQGVAIVADALADHRKAYLAYEGPVGQNRGEVSRWDAGEFTWISQGQDEVVVELDGQRVRGTARLVRDPENAQRWAVWFFSR